MPGILVLFLAAVAVLRKGLRHNCVGFYLHIPLAGAKCASRKAIFQLFPFIKVSFAKIFPFEEPKNFKGFKKCQLLYAFTHSDANCCCLFNKEKKH